MLSTPVVERTIAAVLDRQVSAHPDKPAVLQTDGHSIAYAELQRLAFSLANSLRQASVHRQEPVLMMLDNHIDIVVTWAGLGVGSMIAVPINTAYKGEMLQYVTNQSGAKVAIVEDKYCARFAEILDGVTGLETVYVRGPAGDLPERLTKRDFAELSRAEPLRPDPPLVSDIATIIYTSGTEGRSKGVRCPHGHNFQTSTSYGFETTPDDVVMVVLPLFHGAGLFAGVYNALRGGGTALVPPSFSISQFWDDVRRFGCTQTLLLGAMVDFLWRQPETESDRDHSLRNICVVPAVPYIQAFADRFGVSVESAYGQSETGTPCIASPGEVRPFLCGRPRSFFDVRIVDDHDVEQPPGITGEIIVRSNEPWSMFLGYHGDPVTTLQTMRNGWVHTGDAGFKDELGQVVFVDRRKDALRRRGENVSSLEVENALLERGDIAEAAIVAVPSEHHEDDIKAVVVMTPGAVFDPEAVLRDLYARLPYFMVPRYYEAIDELPRTPTHKVAKAMLRTSRIGSSTWDCEANGFTIARSELKEGARPR